MSEKHVLIVNTGGTIGMKKTANGYAPVEGFLAEAISAIDDMKKPELPKWELHEMSPLLDSSDMTVSEWNKIAEIIPAIILNGITNMLVITLSAILSPAFLFFCFSLFSSFSHKYLLHKINDFFVDTFINST